MQLSKVLCSFDFFKPFLAGSELLNQQILDCGEFICYREERENVREMVVSESFYTRRRQVCVPSVALHIHSKKVILVYR